MTSPYAEVLARESDRLAGVTDAAKLADWRCRVITEVMTPRSPYALALRQTGDLRERAEFLGRWRRLIAEAVDRLPPPDAAVGADGTSTQHRRNQVDPERTAVLILAALHGGSTLSQVSQDPRPLHAALDLALAPFATPDGPGASDAETTQAPQ